MLASDAAAPWRVAARVAVERHPAGRLSFPAIAAVVQEFHLSDDDVGRLIGALRLMDVMVPGDLGGLATPVLPAPSPVAAVPTALQLTGAEVLDVSGILLADLGLLTEPAPVVIPTPREPASPGSTAGQAASRSEWIDDDEPELRPEPELNLDRLYVEQVQRHALLDAAEEVDLATRIEAGVFAQERLDTATDSPQRRRALATVAAEGASAFARFVTANLRLVLSLARQYQNRGLALSDLVQEGNLGLIRAVQKFDVRQGTKFSTYATWWIRQAITRAIADQARTIRYPVHVVEKINVVRRAAVTLTSGSDELPEVDGMAPEEVRTLLTGLPVAVPLNTALDILGSDRLDALHRQRTGDSAEETTLSRGLAVEDVHRALAHCSEREQAVLRSRFGFDGDPCTLDAIGQQFGVTRERIRQIESKALSKVRGALSASLRPEPTPSRTRRASPAQRPARPL